VEALPSVHSPSPLPCFLEVLILKDFKSLFPEVLILRDFKSLSPEVLILVSLKSFVMSEIQKCMKIVEVLIPGDLSKYRKMLILLDLSEKQGWEEVWNSNVNTVYIKEYSTNLDWRQWVRKTN